MTHARSMRMAAAAVVFCAAIVAWALLNSPAHSEPQSHGHAQATERTKHWTPVESAHLYLCAFHVAKDNPKFQVEAHHYCSPAGKDIHQCMIYNSNGSNAKLLGIEYIITDEMYQSLPAAEKKYWHPHAYEILSGQLIAPDMPKQGDDAFPGFLRTWGKTWHTWRDPSTEIPVGEPLLMWSANGDGQVDQALIDKRDAQFGISTAEIRERRKAYGFAVPNIAPPKSVNELGQIGIPAQPPAPRR